MNLYPPAGNPNDRKRHDLGRDSYFDFGPQGRFFGGLSLASKSWQVIRTDRSLLVLPLLQVVFQTIAMAAILAPIGYRAYEDSSRYLVLIGIAAVAFPVNFVATFFGVAFVVVVRGRLEGRPVSLRDALRVAGSRIDVITSWAILSTTVTVAIQALERVRGGAIAARVAGWLIGSAWAIACLFVVPALAAERIGPIAAARTSAGIVKRKWGEGVVGTTAIALVCGFWMIPVFVVGFLGWVFFATAPAFGVTLMAAAVCGYLLIAATQTAVDNVFRFVLFDYGENGAIHAPFTETDLAYGVKSKRRWFSRGS